jgi:altronate dehydratase
MESGLPGLECQAHGGTASKIWMTEAIAVKTGKKAENSSRSACILSKFKIELYCKTSRPTGC